MFWCVLFANGDDKREFLYESEHTGSNIGTAGVVAEIFTQLFIATVRSREARLNRLREASRTSSRMPVLCYG
jgi:hypothetical protein